MVSGVDTVEDNVFLGVTEGVRASVRVWGGDGCARVGGDVIHTGLKAFRIWSAKVVVGGEAEDGGGYEAAVCSNHHLDNGQEGIALGMNVRDMSWVKRGNVVDLYFFPHELVR